LRYDAMREIRLGGDKQFAGNQLVDGHRCGELAPFFIGTTERGKLAIHEIILLETARPADNGDRVLLPL
jgi:hypothetical protein